MPALLALTSVAVAPVRAGEPSPSILVVLMDDARVDGVPWLDAMAREGVRFRNAYASQPQCGPSRASLISGRYREVELRGTTEGFDETDTLATRLQAVGYETAFIGKYINGHQETAGPPGWDRWLAFAGVPHYYDYELIEEDGARQTPAGYATDHLAVELSAFLSAAQGPAFAIWAPYAPHIDTDPAAGFLPVPAPRHRDTLLNLAPWRPPNYDHTLGKPDYLVNVAKGAPEELRRLAMESTLAVAEAIEQLRSAHPELLIFVTSDNGVGWGEHGWHWQRKTCPHFVCTRIPLAAFGPWPSRTVVSAVTLEDLAATVLELGGADRSCSGTCGQSFVPLLEQGDAAPGQRTVVDFHYGGGRDSNPTPPWTAQLDVVTGRLVAVYETGEVEDYDTRRDPWLNWNIAVLPEPEAPGPWLLLALALLVRRARLADAGRR